MNNLHQKLHETYSAQCYDHTDVWAGHLRVQIGRSEYPATLARCYSDALQAAIVEAELYVRDVDWSTSQTELTARVWCDANDLGSVDERGRYHRGSGDYYAMEIKCDPSGRPILSGNNVTLVSELIPINTPGVFHYTVSVSADPSSSEAARRWIPLNDIAYNQDGQIAVSSSSLRGCHSVNEVCLRKVGARVENDSFMSGGISELTQRLSGIDEDVVYLLPFCTPGFYDTHTGEDVRKGTLGSVYAPRDFFEIDPDLVSLPGSVNIDALVADDLILDADLDDLLDDHQRARVRAVRELSTFGHWKELQDWVGTAALTQMVGRAELRSLVNEAHRLGKRVIFDLILMQTSRDNALIREHPEWYVQDENGQPAIHQIAWLVYSDVALLNLPFNRPLQNYLSGIAPFWIERCGFDGVRIDASQTIDRPFLKEIKNRIHRVKEDAIVLGETLCALEDSRDIPVDMVYALFVDFHRDLNSANALIGFAEETNKSFAAGTVAMAYFENHDSVRATRVWRERYQTALDHDEGYASYWEERTGSRTPAVWMAQLKNLQASVINATIGNGGGTRTIYGVEWGTTWGSEVQTDFENPTLVIEDQRGLPPSVYLQRAYASLSGLVQGSEAITDGLLRFYPPVDIGDSDDQLLAYARVAPNENLVMVHNLDPQWTRSGSIDLGDIVADTCDLAFDSYSFSIGNGTSAHTIHDGRLDVTVGPLQSLVIRLGC
jgi:glycosidase